MELPEGWESGCLFPGIEGGLVILMLLGLSFIATPALSFCSQWWCAESALVHRDWGALWEWLSGLGGLQGMPDIVKPMVGGVRKRL